MAAIRAVMLTAGFIFVNLISSKIGMVAVVLARIGTQANNIEGENVTDPFHYYKSIKILRN